MNVIIGISGHKGSGKDTVADELVRHWGFTKALFAEPLKKALNDLFGFHMENWNSLEWKETPNVLCYGLKPRELAQTFGTGWGRNMVDKEVWVDIAMRRVENNPRVVFSDVRFDNEALAIRAAGGVLVRLEKAGYINKDHHESEKGVALLPDFSVTAMPGNLEGLKRSVLVFLAEQELI